MVHELIDWNLCAWKIDLFQRCFKKDEAELILGLPISSTGCEDRVIWHYTKNGDHSDKTRKKGNWMQQQRGFEVPDLEATLANEGTRQN